MKNREKVFWIIGMFILLAGCLQSCVTLEKKIAKAKVVAYQNPNEFADVCATLYPIKETTKTEIKYVPADNKDYTDQIKDLSLSKDSALSELYKLKEIAANDKTDNCIDYKRQIPKLEQKINFLSVTIQKLTSEYEKCKSDTVNVNTTSIQESTAKIKALQNELSKIKTELDKEKESRLEAEKTANKRLWWIIGMGAFIGVATFLRIKRII